MVDMMKNRRWSTQNRTWSRKSKRMDREHETLRIGVFNVSGMPCDVIHSESADRIRHRMHGFKFHPYLLFFLNRPQHETQVFLIMFSPHKPPNAWSFGDVAWCFVVLRAARLGCTENKFVFFSFPRTTKRQ